MSDRQEIMLRLACAAIQGGMSEREVYHSLSEDELAALEMKSKDEVQSNTKVIY